jgi:hypothetical protein
MRSGWPPGSVFAPYIVPQPPIDCSLNTCTPSDTHRQPPTYPLTGLYMMNLYVYEEYVDHICTYIYIFMSVSIMYIYIAGVRQKRRSRIKKKGSMPGAERPGVGVLLACAPDNQRILVSFPSSFSFSLSRWQSLSSSFFISVSLPLTPASRSCSSLPVSFVASENCIRMQAFFTAADL